MKLKADINNGVTRYHSGDEDDYDRVVYCEDGEEFFEKLSSFPEDAMLVCKDISKEWAERIDYEYTIHES